MGTINGNSIQSLESLMTSNGVTTSFTYDAWGRMASKNATIGGTARTAYYSYSYGDKLKHVWTNFPGETTTAYNYDGLGKRRVRITDYNGVNPQTTWWRWDLGWSPLCEYADPNLGWEIEGFAQFNVYNGLMHPLAEAAVSGSPANAAYSYLALDHLSSTRAVYNQAKTATASLEFYPYGETFATTGTLPDARFTAKPYDPETGLYYFPYRYYSPTASRWTSRDPLGMVDGPNVYGYTKSLPIRYVDRDGRAIAQTLYFGVLSACGIYSYLDGFFFGPWGLNTQHCVVGCKLKKCAGWLIGSGDIVYYMNYVFERITRGQDPDSSMDDEAALFGAKQCSKDCASCEECCSHFYPPFE
jgi:RHS repeat-associated protein